MFYRNPYASRLSFSELWTEDGTITVKHKNGKEIKIDIEGWKVKEKKLTQDRKIVHWLKYGEFEKERKSGTTHKIMRYRRGTAKGKDGLCVRKDIDLEGYSGTCYTFFCRGRLLWQKFIYPNKVVAYYLRHTHTVVKAKRPDKKPLFKIEGEKLNFKGAGYGEPFVYSGYDGYYYEQHDGRFNLSETKCSYEFYDKRGRIKDKGCFENRQKTGEWIKNYKTYCFISGIPVEKSLYHAKPEDIDANRVLAEPNSQLRAMLLKKIGLERVVNECDGKLIHEDKRRKNRLYDFPVKNKEKRYHGNTNYSDEDDMYDEAHIRILQVTCTTTKGQYFLRVPALPDWNTCEKARQGTFNGFTPNAKHIKFAKET